MSTYKITNVTHLLGKRDFKFNSILDVDYVDGMLKKTVKIKPNDSLFLTVSSLPLSVHRLRVKGLIAVTEVNSTELENALKTAPPKSQEVKKVEIDEQEESVHATKKTGKKKTTKR
jgi:hypothetical protein